MEQSPSYFVTVINIFYFKSHLHNKKVKFYTFKRVLIVKMLFSEDIIYYKFDSVLTNNSTYNSFRSNRLYGQKIHLWLFKSIIRKSNFRVGPITIFDYSYKFYFNYFSRNRFSRIIRD